MGARGPAPDPNAIRRDRPSDQATWITLPASREGEPPDWPFSDSMTEHQADLWRSLWTLPQAVMWEQNRRHVEVALHVETVVDATYGYWVDSGEVDREGNPRIYRGNPAPMRSLALKQQESLGLTAQSMARLRWRIGNETAKEAPKRGRSGTIDKARFSVIQGEATG